MWWKIAKLAGLFFLGFGAAQDIKYQKISTEYLLAGSCAAILYRGVHNLNCKQRLYGRRRICT